MPRKKERKSSDKQNKEKKTPNKNSSASDADKINSDDKEMEFYLIQIRYLTGQKERYQQKCDELERQVKDLTSQFSTLETEKKDVVEYLKRSLLVKEDEVDELTERLEGQQLAANKDREALQLQHSQQRQELHDRIEELTAENETLVVRLDALEGFQKHKEKLISNMATLERQLATQEEEHKDAIHSLEMKMLMEQTRLEKDMQSQVAAIAAEVQHKVNQKIPEATRLALEENTEVKARLSQLSEHTLVLMRENGALRDHKSQLSLEVDSLEEMFREVSRQSCIRKKAAEQLKAKCQQLQEDLKDCQQELKQLQTKHTGVLAEMEALRKRQKPAGSSNPTDSSIRFQSSRNFTKHK